MIVPTMLLPLLALLVATAQAATPPSGCQCGFQDPRTNQLYTEAIIVYFNETDTIDPEIFEVQDFEQHKQQGWNSVWRTGATPDNVAITNDTYMRSRIQSLELHTSPSTKTHLIRGGSLKTQRQDLQYGSFQAGLRGAARYTGGTALSFMLHYNASEGLNMDVLNMGGNGSEARVSYTVNGEWPAQDTVTNYTVLEAAGLDPWGGYLDYRMQWNETDFAAFIDGNETRAVTSSERSVPMAGQPMFLRSWSTGDEYYMDGPPGPNGSRSRVLYVRSFFNSSAMTEGEHRNFDRRCGDAEFCSIDDMSLRGATAYGEASKEPWVLRLHKGRIRENAGIVAACCSSFGIFALINVFFRRTPWGALVGLFKPKKNKRRSFHPSIADDSASDIVGFANTEKIDATESVIALPEKKTSVHSSGAETPQSGLQTPMSGLQTPLPAYHAYEANPPPWSSAYSRNLSRNASLASLPRFSESSDRDDINAAPTMTQPIEKEMAKKRPLSNVQEAVEPMTAAPLAITEKGKEVAVTAAPIEVKAEAEKTMAPLVTASPPKKRIDYLAGIVAVACLGVTLSHFFQTFLPWITQGYGPGAHWPEVERWLAIVVGAYVLNGFWIGMFFLTATRFLCANFLKNGKLDDIAKKELRRAPRLFVPIIIISLLQYFLISMNVTASLEYLPSVSFTTWPYVTAQPNFGVWINNMVEIAYLMPNAIPEVVTHYCIGVLWTVPVQLQFTYVILTGAVLIRPVKTPWKRFGFMALAIVLGWYAKSWGAIHWCGLVLADLEVTYKWRNYLDKHRVVFWIVCIGALMATAGTPLLSVFNSDWSFDTAESGIHPDLDTGRPLIAVHGSLYPDYNEPTLAIMIFGIGLQTLVELSSWFQAFLSWKPILWLHPHIMTIYLTHGFVMWTWGAWCAVKLAESGRVPYWANLLVTFVTTYFWIFMLASVMTPLLEYPTQALTRNMERWNTEEPLPKRMTIAPYGKELVIKRMEGETQENGTA